MKKILFILSFVIGCSALGVAQNVTRTQHRTAVTTDAVTTGTMTIRKPDYICIATDEGRERLVMDGTLFTTTIGGKQHVTDSRTNPLFARFHEVLKSVIMGQPVTEDDQVTVTTGNGGIVITITPATKKKRQLFTSFVLVVDDKTWAFRQLRLNQQAGNYIQYDFNE